MTFYDFLQKGGLLMIPLAVCSLLAISLFFERLWGLARVRVIPPDFTRALLKLVHAGSVQDDHQDLEGGLQH